jgi:hypothetical protein
MQYSALMTVGEATQELEQEQLYVEQNEPCIPVL